MPAGVSAWTPLANTTTTSSVTSVTFSSISQSYKDLVLVMNPALSNGNGPFLTLNAVFTGFRWEWLQSDGSSAVAATSTSGDFPMNSNYFVSAAQTVDFVWHIMDYSATDKQKQMLGRFGTASAGTGLVTARWESTAAITSVSIAAKFGGTINSGVSFALYGVSA